MPLPKGIKAALDAWKAGTGEFPTDLDDGVFFPSTGAFDAEVRRKSKGVESQAKEAAMAKFLAEAGLTDESQIAELRETIEKSGVLKTEADKSKTQMAKLTKDLEDSRKENETFKGQLAATQGKIKDIAKRDALSKYAPQTTSLEFLSLKIVPDLEVADDGTVTVKSDPKKSLDDMVAETLKAYPILKSPAFKEGTGTRSTPEKKTNVPFTPPTDDKDKPLTVAQRMINELVAAGKIPAPTDQIVTNGGP